MKLFDNKPNYVRLDDDVSFQILRTNPKLTTNTKLMYDGENLYMDAYQASPLLSTLEYKHHRVWKTGLFNRDIRNFLLGTSTTAYEVGQNVDDTVLLTEFDNQFENMYWSGVESINSEIYPQEMGCIAPLYIRKKLPNYFIIFKIDTPANTNLKEDVGDYEYKFEEDIRDKIKIVKSFDLKEGTPIGDYIRRYISQRDFKYDQSIYVNFSSNDIYYYGIDRSSGVLTQKVENFKEQLLDNDNTVMKVDSWITEGFERNNLIFPYIINIEFLFDDNETSEYSFARYFGMYCNDIDLYNLENERYEVVYKNGKLKLSKITLSNTSKDIGDSDYDDSDYDDSDYDDYENDNIINYNLENNINFKNENLLYYIKDKLEHIYSIEKNGKFICGDVKIDNLTGFELDTLSIYAEKISGFGNPILMFRIKDPNCEEIHIHANSGQYILTPDSNLELGDYEIYTKNKMYFSSKGKISDVAKTIATLITESEIEDMNLLYAYSDDDVVIVEVSDIGSKYNGSFHINPGDYRKIEMIIDTSCGGTDVDGCMFKVYTEDKCAFFEDGVMKDRYIKCKQGSENTKAIAFIPYIYDGKISDEYSILITDERGKDVYVTRTNQIEILDVFYPKIGVLSMFPVRDFDFDTLSSPYGDYSLIEKEIEGLHIDVDNIENHLSYKRFYDDKRNNYSTEYDYYCENLLPELSTVNKTVPYVVKWSYADEAKDSCENPYKLNTNKVFDACNFSANTFMQKGDIREFTHSMPYYISIVDDGDSDLDYDYNQYQYIEHKGEILYGDLEEYFSRKKFNDNGEEQNDPFDEFFGDLSQTRFKNKRYNKKYSRFLFGSSAVNPSTLFRGVKFEITELDRNKEVKTGKYNGYKFSCIYVPIPVYDEGDSDSDYDISSNNILYSNLSSAYGGFDSDSDSDYEKYYEYNEDEYTNHMIKFIKNDDFKFIVCIVYFNIKADYLTKFNKAYVYAHMSSLI